MSVLNTNQNLAIPPPSQVHLDRGYGVNSQSQSNIASSHPATDRTTPGNPIVPSPLSQSAAQNYGRFNEEWDASQRGSSIVDGQLHRSNSGTSQGDGLIPSRGATLKKKASLKRSGSFKRSSSRRSSRAGSVRSLALQTPGDIDEMRSAFFSPVPTTGNPTDILANRFQVWRKVLKDLIAYFKEIQTQYDHRSKSLLKVSNVINNTTTASIFRTTGGVDDALQILRSYHKTAVAESTKARDIENDVILALVGLRSDLNQKIKEIKSLAGDFKNSVEKEMETTRRLVNHLQEGLGQSDIDPAQMTGKQDPYLLKLAVDRQIERQIDEENYLHQAYLNLEASGRELEAIVVGEIQKAYNAYAGILKREADAAYAAVEELRTGPIAMPKDHEWNSFIENDDHFVDPRIPVREPQNIQYPGRDNELAQEVRAGLLERKSRYLKKYEASWFVLTPTHLHEFKSPDKTQAPLMSLFLPEQKLGSHSSEGASSNKFMLKGRQTGSMHRGHSWIFRAESYETLLAWYDDIKSLTEKSPQERNAFVRQHARSVSGTSQKAGSVSSDGAVDDEDEEPFSATAAAVVAQGPKQDVLPRRPEPGGRFPSDLQVNTQRSLQAPLSPSSGSSGFGDVQDHDITTAAGAPPSSGVGQHHGEYRSSPTHAEIIDKYADEDHSHTYQPFQKTRVAEHEQYNSFGIAAAVTDPEHSRYHEEQNFVNSPRDSHPQPYHHEALEGSPVTSVEIHKQISEQAAHESTGVSDPNDMTATAESKIMAGEHGDISSPNPEAMNGAVPEQNTAAPQALLQHDPVKALSRTPTGEASRPRAGSGDHHLSIQSISQLHIPGEFPKGAEAKEIL